MKKKSSAYLLTLVFLLILFLPQPLWLMLSEKQDGGSAEKRELAQKPSFSLETAAAFPKAYEAYYNDHLPFRQMLIRIYSRVMHDVFHTSASDKVIIGREGWLFYNNPDDYDSLACYNGEKLLADTTLDMIASSLIRTRDRLVAENIDFVLFITPEKERMYSEYMPRYLGEPAQQCMVHQVVSYLKEHTDLKVIYAYDALMAYKRAHAGQELYFRTDTHWNALGGYIGTRALLMELGIELPAEPDVMMGDAIAGDLAGLLNLQKDLPEDRDVIVTGYTAQQATCVESEDDRYWFETEDHTGQRLLMLRDSFGEGMIPVISSQFASGCIVHRDRYSPEIREKVQPDIVVYEVTERTLPHMMFMPEL